MNIGEHAFAQMQGDLDRQRLLGERPPADPLADIMLKQMQQKERYLFVLILCCFHKIPKDVAKQTMTRLGVYRYFFI